MSWRAATSRLLYLTLLLSATGCGLFSRSPNRYFTLERIAPAGAVTALAGAPIAIGGIELPPGLDRREIVVRQEANRLEIRGRELWTAPLQPMVLHTLAFDLAGRLPEGMVILPGQTQGAGTPRVIDVVFEELAAGPDPVVVLDARWTSGGVARHERLTVPIESLESANVASGTSLALAELADRIVAALGGVRPAS